ncbi:MAG: ABC transporter ATP-binding protein [Ilumatobacteraceae bacterium]|jgi:teichoic acid transport system ATP-binding protein|nr:ABC transporter ATP-binding protein [Ilumatobacteraceae bacterium]MBJ7507951.1 ABC transporter ATP-binding protein [Ilumatobacteraceae bacterium]
MTELSVRVTDLHIEFEVFSDRRAGLRQRLATKEGSGRRVIEAVNGVSFETRRGEAIGVIGSNGSGKSTLLSALAGLIKPTSGEILVSCEPKLLGVGAVLLNGATGIRNIRLGCLALGMSSDELDDRVAEIVEFTGLGEAIDRPLKTYSAGMRARLHFAIATAVQPEILLVDEALSVGDKEFRKKSRAKIESLLANAGTLFLVSHSTKQIERLCTRGLWLENGKLLADGPIADVIAQYGDDD